MRLRTRDLRLAVFASAAVALATLPARGEAATNSAYWSGSQPAVPEAAQATNGAVYPIDLPTALRLAGARNLDIQIAREALNEAEANRKSAVEQFFPWIAPGFGYHRRDGEAQAVPAGVNSSTHFQSYSPGAALVGGRLLVEFRTPPSSNFVRNLLVRGVGAYSYTSVTGAYVTVPHLLVLHQLPDSMSYSLNSK